MNNLVFVGGCGITLNVSKAVWYSGLAYIIWYIKTDNLIHLLQSVYLGHLQRGQTQQSHGANRFSEVFVQVGLVNSRLFNPNRFHHHLFYGKDELFGLWKKFVCVSWEGQELRIGAKVWCIPRCWRNRERQFFVIWGWVKTYYHHIWGKKHPLAS